MPVMLYLDSGFFEECNDHHGHVADDVLVSSLGSIENAGPEQAMMIARFLIFQCEC